MIQAYWLKTKNDSNIPANQLEYKMNQDLYLWRVKTIHNVMWQTYN